MSPIRHRGLFALFALSLTAASVFAEPRVQFDAAQTVPQGPLKAEALYLRSGTAFLPSLDARQITNALNQRDAQTRQIIQFDRPLTEQDRKNLVEAGVTLFDYLPSNAYIADLSQADADRLARLGITRWIGEFQSTWKLDPELGARAFTTDTRKQIDAMDRSLLAVTLFAGIDTHAALDQIRDLPETLVHDHAPVGGNEVVVVELPKNQWSVLAQLGTVQFVEEQPEITFRNSTTRWIVQSNVNAFFPVYDRGIRGENQIIGVLDGAVDINHCSFSNGKIIHYNAAGSSGHGTHVAATAAGDNGVDNDTRGIAYEANLVTNSIPSFNESAINQRLNLHHSQGARVHTNSWGNDGTTSYDSLARGFDVFCHNEEESFVCLAVTNGSALRNPENAKNLLAVGASQDTPSQGNHCSAGIGPTSDGRRKPELYAPGCSTLSASAGSSCSVAPATGTSMACPAVAGAAALVRQYYTEGYHPAGEPIQAFERTPTGALIKATLLNSAVDMTGVSGYPSNLEGWGRVLLDDTLFFLGDSRTMYIEDIRNADGLTTGQEMVLPVTVLGSSEQARFTVVWTEPAASAGASFAHVNNLDLEVTSPSGIVYKGNVFSGGESVTGGTFDDRNNVEQVHVSDPEIGAWIVKVSGTAINSGSQGFALVASGDVDSAGGPIPLLMSVAATPPIFPPNTSTTFDVTIRPGDDAIVANSAQLYYRYDIGAFQQAPLTFLSGETWQATLPGATCASTPEYYVAVEGADTGVVTAPADAPLSLYSSIVGVQSVSAAFDFNADPSWAISGSPSAGAWERVTPGNFGAADPATDSDGSGMCFVTGNTASETVRGETILTTQTYDASAPGTLTYDYWFNIFGVAPGTGGQADSLRVEFATNAGATNWAPLRNHNTVDNEWNTATVSIGGEIPTTPTLTLRFIASEFQFPTPMEAGIDNFELIAGIDCEDAQPCDGDADGNGVVDVNDISYVLFRLGDSGTPGTVDGDADASGTVDVNDISYVLFRLGPCA